jgi:hypothetical protein
MTCPLEYTNRKLILPIIYAIYFLLFFTASTFAFTMSEYFPLKTGNIWMYDRNLFAAGPDLHNFSKYQGTALVDAREYYDGIIYFNSDTDGILMVGFYETASKEYIDLSEAPIKFAAGEMTLGQTITSISSDLEDWSIDFASTLQAVETIETNAGTFSNTLKLKIVVTDQEGVFTENIWLAKGIGIVKAMRVSESPANYDGCVFTCGAFDYWSDAVQQRELNLMQYIIQKVPPCDIDKDGKIGLAEAVYALKTASGQDLYYSIAGSYGSGFYAQGIQNSGEAEYVSITFYPNGYYVHYETGQPSEQCDNGGGVEYGTYSYNPDTRQLAVIPLVDENGCVGLADDGQSGTAIVGVTKDSLIFYADNNDPEITLDRVADDTSPLVGSWGQAHYLNYPGITSEYMSLTFYPGGYYIHWSSDTPAPEDFSGAEYGIWAYNAVTGNLTINVTVDENGDAGLSEGIGTSVIPGVSVNADTITLGNAQFVRVK